MNTEEQREYQSYSESEKNNTHKLQCGDKRATILLSHTARHGEEKHILTLESNGHKHK